MAEVAAVALVQSLAWELPCTVGVAKKKKEEEGEEEEEEENHSITWKKHLNQSKYTNGQ